MGQALGNETMKEDVRSRREQYLKEYSRETVAKRIATVIDNSFIEGII
jgi:hypothetical protein